MQIKKSALAAIVLSCSLVFTTIGVAASSGIEKISASLNHNIKFVLNGSNWQPKDANGNKLSALVYNGSTYVPLKAVSEALGAEAKWNSSTSSITINTGDQSGVPYLDGDNSSNNNSGSNSSNSNSNSSNPSSSSNDNDNEDEDSSGPIGSLGSYGNPVPFNTSFTFSDNYSYEGFETSATYTYSITKTEPITRDQITKLGFQKPDSADDINYVLVTVKVSVKNAKLVKSKNKDEYISVYFEPRIWGSKTVDNEYIIGGTSYGFDGSLNGAVDKAVGYKKLKVGESTSYSATGKVILPIVKGKENYIVINKRDSSNYDDSLKHFKLK